MKRMKFLTAALCVAIVAAIALTGCDEVLNEPKKGTETEVTGYGIISADQSAVICVFTLDPQGGDMGIVPKGSKGEVTKEIPYGERAEKPAHDPTKAGYTFGGWYTDTAFRSPYDFTTPVTADITIYAKWEPIPYKLTYSLNGAPGTPPDSLGDLTYGQTITEPAAPQWPGHTFGGWFLNADGTGTAWNFETDTVTGDFTLYAKWTLGDGPTTFAEVVEDMKAHPGPGERSYTLPSGNEDFTTKLILTTDFNSPAEVTINGGGRVVTGSTNSITVGSGVTLTLMNITFKTLPLSVSAGGKLVLDNGSVVRENLHEGVMVDSGILEMNTGALVTENGDPSVDVQDSSGTGVCIEGTGAFTMNGGTISGNNNRRGGGVRLEGPGVFTMNGGKISGNNGSHGGGVTIWNDGAIAPFTMNGGEISGNTASFGGGVCLFGSNSVDANRKIRGDPQEGGTNPGAGKGWIHDNTAYNIHWP
jgi:uncharacterized repeat protein (TIGR02543 family)